MVLWVRLFFWMQTEAPHRKESLAHKTSKIIGVQEWPCSQAFPLSSFWSLAVHARMEGKVWDIDFTPCECFINVYQG